jgi:hypothetical protein
VFAAKVILAAVGVLVTALWAIFKFLAAGAGTK